MFLLAGRLNDLFTGGEVTMIDTVTVAWSVERRWDHLKNWVRHPIIPPNREYMRDKYFIKMDLGNGAPVDCTYYPANKKYPDPRLQLQVSLPRAIYGDNIEMITTKDEIERAIRIGNDFLAKQDWGEYLDLGAGTLVRVDGCYNHLVGEEHMQDYLTAISRLTYPHRKTFPYLKGQERTFEGVQFCSSSSRPAVVLSFYDKCGESHNPLAQGLLRQESSIRRADYIGNWLGLEAPTLRDVTISKLKDKMQRDLGQVGLDKNCICDRSIAMDKLIGYCGCNEGFKLFGYLCARQTMDCKQLEAVFGADARTMRRWNKQVADAGVSLAMVDTPVPLQPLSIDVLEVIDDLDL